MTQEEINKTVSSALQRGSKKLSLTLVLVIVGWIFSAGLLYAQVQTNTKTISTNTQLVAAVPVLAERLKSLEDNIMDLKQNGKETNVKVDKLFNEVKDNQTELLRELNMMYRNLQDKN